MIVLAADYVGLKIVEFLIEQKAPVQVWVYDEEDHGGTRDAIVSVIKERVAHPIIYSSEEIKRTDIQAKISEMNLNLGILAWWPYILSKEDIARTRRGFVNTHPAFLPYNRGKHPYFWSLVENTPFGVSIHWISPGIDDGAVIARRRIETDWLDTGESLYHRARELMVDLFREIYPMLLNDEVEAIPQDEETHTFHYGKELEPFCEIDLDREYKARDLLNILRGRMFQGVGKANFEDNGKRYYVSIKIREE